MAGFEKGCQVVRIREFIERMDETGRITGIVELLNEHKADVILSGMQVGSCAVGCASSQGKRTAGVREEATKLTVDKGYYKKVGSPTVGSSTRKQEQKRRADAQSSQAVMAV